MATLRMPRASMTMYSSLSGLQRSVRLGIVSWPTGLGADVPSCWPNSDQFGRVRRANRCLVEVAEERMSACRFTAAIGTSPAAGSNRCGTALDGCWATSGCTESFVVGELGVR